MKWIERGGRECLLFDYLFISLFPFEIQWYSRIFERSIEVIGFMRRWGGGNGYEDVHSI